jgi:glycosyltransferase involved in cell wall biosynthesis
MSDRSPLAAERRVVSRAKPAAISRRIGFAFHRDAANPSVQSSRPFSILHGLQADGHQVERLFPLNVQVDPRAKLRKLFYRAMGRHYRWDRDPELLDRYAREIESLAAGKAIDFFFSPGTEVISHLRVDQPITFCADATFENMLGYYSDFDGLPAGYVEKGHQLERDALSRAALAVYPSRWAAKSAIDFYGTPSERVAVIPFGANVGAENLGGTADQWLAQRRAFPLRLIFLGRDWQRKGGDIVFQTMQLLVADGTPVELHVVGTTPPPEVLEAAGVTLHGTMNPNNEKDRRALGDLLCRSHFLFMPTRAEAYGMAFCEANAFAVPNITTRTGGVAEIIRDGINGYALPLTAGPREYAEVITRAFRDWAEYRDLARSSFDEFRTRLNWNAFCKSFLGLVESRIFGVKSEASVS